MSSPSSYSYETVFVTKSGISEADASTIHQKIDSVIGKFQGKLTQRDDWGIRELAYPVSKETHGKYSVVIYTGKAGVVEEMERHFKISDLVIRFLTVMVQPSYYYAKVKKLIHLSEEEVKKNREAREQRKRMQ